jgi:hypothetical protein
LEQVVSLTPQNLTIVKPNKNAWLQNVWKAGQVAQANVVRRAVSDVHKNVGEIAFVKEVRRKGFHLIRTGSQYVIICNPGFLQVVC